LRTTLPRGEWCHPFRYKIHHYSEKCTSYQHCAIVANGKRDDNGYVELRTRDKTSYSLLTSTLGNQKKGTLEDIVYDDLDSKKLIDRKFKFN
jgi:hypothetical protein